MSTLDKLIKSICESECNNRHMIIRAYNTALTRSTWYYSNKKDFHYETAMKALEKHAAICALKYAKRCA